MSATAPVETARVICRSSLVAPERAVAARAADGAQVALVRIASGELFAVGHFDPFSRANVVARGIVGTATVDGTEVDVIQSPMYKQAFDLRTGRCLTDQTVSLGVWAVHEEDGMIVLGAREVAAATGVA
jgi:nitrite reductase (NADH) small subunit